VDSSARRNRRAGGWRGCRIGCRLTTDYERILIRGLSGEGSCCGRRLSPLVAVRAVWVRGVCKTAAMKESVERSGSGGIHHSSPSRARRWGFRSPGRRECDQLLRSTQPMGVSPAPAGPVKRQRLPAKIRTFHLHPAHSGTKVNTPRSRQGVGELSPVRDRVRGPGPRPRPRPSTPSPMQFFEPSAPAHRHETSNGHLDRRDRIAGASASGPMNRRDRPRSPMLR
jgi:hypothetical protein